MRARSACEAGVSLKPEAQAPGSDLKDKPAARKTGDSVKLQLSPAVAGSSPFGVGALTWGLRPRLYAYACYRRLRNIIRFRLFVQSYAHVFSAEIAE